MGGYISSSAVIIVFIVHSMADGLMSFPSHYFRSAARKLISMKDTSTSTVFYFPLCKLAPSASVKALNTRTQLSHRSNESPVH